MFNARPVGFASGKVCRADWQLATRPAPTGWLGENGRRTPRALRGGENRRSGVWPGEYSIGKAIGSRKLLKALTRLGAGETGTFTFSFFF